MQSYTLMFQLLKFNFNILFCLQKNFFCLLQDKKCCMLFILQEFYITNERKQKHLIN